MSKTSLLMKKVSIALTGGIAISTMASCGSTPEPVDDSSDTYYETTQPTYESTGSTVDEPSSYDQSDSSDSGEEYSEPEMPYDENCNDWEFDEVDGVWICNDHSSLYYRSFFFMGTYFATKNLLHSNSGFKQYKSSNVVSGTSSATKKSGFGSGASGGYGG